MSPILINEWIESTKKAEGNPGAGSGDWAIQKVLDLSSDGCWDQVWDFILGVTVSTDSDWVLSCLGAGPLEDLLCSKCAEYLDRVADCANRSDKFKKALRSVWLDSSDTPLYSEIYKIAGIEPPFD